jgi:hypothetical protein
VQEVVNEHGGPESGFRLSQELSGLRTFHEGPGKKEKKKT